MRNKRTTLTMIVVFGIFPVTTLAQTEIEIPADPPTIEYVDGVEIPLEGLNLQLDYDHEMTIELVPLQQTQAPTVDEIISAVQDFYDSIENYHADFEQTLSNLALGTDEVAEGHVYFRKPGMMRWDYTSPEEKYLVSDGEVLWIYQPEFNQVYRQEISTSEMLAAVRFLMGESELTDDFEISFLDECEAENAYCLALIPLTSEGQYRSIELVVDSEDFSVRETTIVDPVNNRNRFVFTNVSTTDELPESGFTFVPPEGARFPAGE